MAWQPNLGGGVRCTECGRDVDEFTTIAERWFYYSDARDLYPYCPPCAKRAFADDAPRGAQLPDHPGHSV